MKKLLVTAMMLCCAGMVMAQKIDFNKYGRSEEKNLEPGYTPWIVTEAESATKDFDGITVTVSPDVNYSGIHVMSEYWKQGVETLGYKLVGDGLAVYGDDHSRITSGAVKLDVKIEGLSEGHHSLQAYHNNVEGQNAPKVDVYVNGVRQLAGVAQTNRATTVKDSGKSFVEFDVEEGETIVVSYVTVPEDGLSYGTTTVTVNAFDFDVAGIVATDPQPANKDYHAGTDDGRVTFSWIAAEGITNHKLVLGTDPDIVATSTDYMYEGSETKYTKTGLYSMPVYYWRVDEVEADGTIHKGSVWSFKLRQLAFPEAEGYGRYAIGGRGGIVYHVTTLSGDVNEPGSFLYGLVNIDEPRYIVFDVSGTIELDVDGIIAYNNAGNDPKSFPSYFSKSFAYIAGQTAPGKGVCIKSSNIGLGSDVICRHMRFKRGGSGGTGNALGCGNNNTIIDHTTAAWGTDETFSSRGAKNITFQHNMISEALGITGHKNYSDGTNHGFAATIGGSVGSFSHNLLVNCNGRNWSMGGGMDGAGKAAGELDMFNNVCYNWYGRTTDGGARLMQFVNNYYKMGADTKRKELFIAQNEDFGSTRQQFAYVSGNIRENKDHSLTNDKLGDTYKASGPDQESTWYDEPFFESFATIHTAKEAMKIVTSYAGATMPCRDDQHLRNIKETLDGTWTYKGSRSGIKGEIDHEDDAGGWETYPEEQRAADWDTDQDGMPDWWEEMTGSNASEANQNDDPNKDGWTLLEDYLEFMAHPYLIINNGTAASMELKPHFMGFYGQNGNSVTPTYSVSTESTNFTPAVADGKLTVTAGHTQGYGYADVTVNDGATTWTQRFGVAVTSGTTGISSVSCHTTATDRAAPYYDLQGRRIVNCQLKKGLYIHNGGKVVIH